MGRDSVLGTLLVAAVLCVACALLVTSTRVALRDLQETNKQLDRKKNILLAAGLISDEAEQAEIEQVYNERVKAVLVNLDKGAVVSPSEVDYATYDAREALSNTDRTQPIEAEGGPTPGVDRREKLAFVYEIREGEKVDLYVLPIYGKGLWSTLWGFLAIDADGRTLRGITFYEHGETPGLGGEVDNDAWKAQWSSEENPKLAYDEEGDVAIKVIKGSVDRGSPNAKYQVDGLSGATITTRGVSEMVQYWLGPDGFGPYLKSATGVESEPVAVR
jgi:Na+-transporting NADH:ubiquinone oxidoreductase subunit C